MADAITPLGKIPGSGLSKKAFAGVLMGHTVLPDPVNAFKLFHDEGPARASAQLEADFLGDGKKKGEDDQSTAVTFQFSNPNDPKTRRGFTLVTDAALPPDFDFKSYVQGRDTKRYSAEETKRHDARTKKGFVRSVGRNMQFATPIPNSPTVS